MYIIFQNIIFIFSEKEILTAVRKGNLDVLKVLLEKRKEKNPIIYEYSSGTTSTVLHLAAYYGHVKIIEFYKNDLKFDDINPLDSTKTFTPMKTAVQQGKVDVIQYYIDSGYNASSKNLGLLFIFLRYKAAEAK